MSGQLKKLEGLTSKRADQTRQLLTAELRTLHQLDQHCAELTLVNQEYQQSLVERTAIGPQLLEQRRAFVEQLTLKIDQLADARNEKLQLVEAINTQYKQRTAEHEAIGIMNKKQTEHDELMRARGEQQLMDDAARQQFSQQLSGRSSSTTGDEND